MMSMDELARITPVNPPIVNRNTNPRAHSMGVSIFKWALIIVEVHLNTLIPVGMAMIIVAAVKYARVSTSIPIVNMWCAQTVKPRNPIVIIA